MKKEIFLFVIVAVVVILSTIFIFKQKRPSYEEIVDKNDAIIESIVEKSN